MKIHLLFAIISVIISFLLFLFLSNIFSPFFISQIEYAKLDYDNTVFYRDLNYDKESEKILIGKTKGKKLYFLTIHNNDGTVRDQFNFFNETNEELISFYDLNHDNYEEIFVFTKSDSVLYLNIIDSKTLEFIRKDVVIFKKSNKVLTDFWDLRRVVTKFNDIDNDDVIELVLSPITGHSIYPRGLYVFDTNDFELKYSFSITSPIDKFIFYDINRDGKVEILAHGGTSGNTKVQQDFHDHTNWLFTLNSKLELIKEPFSIGKFPSNLQFNIIHKDHSEYILLVFHNYNNKNPEDAFFLMDQYQRIQGQKTLTGKSIYSYFHDNDNMSDHFYLSFHSGSIEKYNSELEEVNSLLLSKGDYNILDEENICEDIGDELVLSTFDKIIVLSSELEKLFEINFTSGINKYSLCYSNSIYPLISISTSNGNYLYQVKQNYLSKYRIPLFLLLSITFYFLILMIHRIISRIVRVIGAYNYTYDDVKVGIIITDYLGNIKSYNKSILQNLPPSMSITKNRKIFKVFEGNIEFLNVVSDAFENETEKINNLEFSKENFKFIGTVEVLPLLTLFKIPHSFVIKIQNFAEQIERDRSSIWAKISQKIAHDIKTPLSTIQLNLSALKSRLSEFDYSEKKNMNDDIEMIESEVRQITKLTKGFLKISNLEKPNFQWISIKDIITETQRPFNKYFDNGMRLNWEVEDELKAIWTDPNQIVQLLHILIENSIDALDFKGQIKISIALVEDLQLARERYVEILISDNGKGIAEQHLGKIFEPYFTQKKDGTGMGLSIAKKIVEDHGGTIDVNSKLNFGTTIIIKIPHKEEV